MITDTEKKKHFQNQDDDDEEFVVVVSEGAGRVDGWATEDSVVVD